MTKIKLSKEDYELLERESKKYGLTVQQGVSLACLHYFKKHNKKIFEEYKAAVDPEVLRAFEKSHVTAIRNRIAEMKNKFG